MLVKGKQTVGCAYELSASTEKKAPGPEELVMVGQSENKVAVNLIQDRAQPGHIFCLLQNCLKNIVTFIFK